MGMSGEGARIIPVFPNMHPEHGSLWTGTFHVDRLINSKHTRVLENFIGRIDRDCLRKGVGTIAEQ